MTVFFTILIKIMPLYLMILLGYIAAKKLNVPKEPIARLLLYLVVPVITFYGGYTTEKNISSLSLPLLFFLICTSISLLFLAIGKYVFKKDSTKNILAFTAGAANAGYFGLPVIQSVLGEEAFSLAVVALLGFIFYEMTIGFFITAKGNYTVKESLRRVARLPIIYAFFLGLALNFLHVELGEVAVTTVGIFKGSYTLLGMMIIGMGLSTIKIKHIDFKFIAFAFLAKFIVWPLIIGGVIFLNERFFHIYQPEIYNVFILLSIVPLSASTVMVATELKVHPDKAAIAVMISTLFALVYIPLVTSLFML